jgi:hypothetical protein
MSDNQTTNITICLQYAASNAIIKIINMKYFRNQLLQQLSKIFVSDGYIQLPQSLRGRHNREGLFILQYRIVHNELYGNLKNDISLDKPFQPFNSSTFNQLFLLPILWSYELIPLPPSLKVKRRGCLNDNEVYTGTAAS